MLVFQQAGQKYRRERGYLSTPCAYHHTRTDVTVSAADYRATYGALPLAVDALNTHSQPLNHSQGGGSHLLCPSEIPITIR